MSRKIWFTIIIAIVLSGISVATVFASEPVVVTGVAGRRGVGELVSTGQEGLTIRTRQDDEYTFRVDEGTIFRSSNGDLISKSDLQIGQWVAGAMTRDEAGRWVLRLLIQLPEGSDNAGGLIRRMAGVITVVQPEASRFILHTRLGGQVTLRVDNGTRYLGQISGLNDMQAGMQALVGALRQPDGTWLALAVGARQPVMRFGGEVTQVDLETSTFNLMLRGGETVTLHVEEATHFVSPDGSVHNLADLQPGMLALVKAWEDPDGAFLVKAVAAATKDQLQRFDLRTGGKVIEVGLDSFTIRTRSDESLTFQVTSETRFRSRGGFVQSLEDMKPGMLVLVGARDLGEADYLAQGVMILRQLPMR